MSAGPDLTPRSSTVENPLSHRLLRRLVTASLLFILPLAAGRAWWEYSRVLSTVHEELREIEHTLAPPLARSLWDVNLEQARLLLEGSRSGRTISHASVVDKGRVLAASGERKERDVVVLEAPLTHQEAGRSYPLGTLVLEAQLEPVRLQALDTAVRAGFVAAALIAAMAATLYLLTRDLISRHLESLARHFESLGPEPGESGFPSLRLDKKPAGDELDMVTTAVNRMQAALARSYAHIRAAETEALSQARFPLENPNPVLRVSADGLLLSANPSSQLYRQHLGCEPGKPLPEDVRAAVARAIESGQAGRFQQEFAGRVFDFVASPVVAGGYVNLYGSDVTDRERAMEAVQAALTEKEVLLKEIHHRVKNNLHVVSSLLFLQAEYVPGEAEKELFRESQRRIQAMALVHEELYGAADLSSVDMREYVRRLTEKVLATAPTPVRLDCRAEELRLPVTLSVPCGLVLNELVMNAVKHAFPASTREDGERELLVSLTREGGQAVLCVRDNGPGLPPGFEMSASPTLGMTLIYSLTQQLGGDMTAEDARPGALFRLSFPLPDSGAGA